MISVAEAQGHLARLTPQMGIETVPLRQANGRVLAQDMMAKRDQPPFAASAMDGYAVSSEDARPGAALTVIGEAAAGARFDGSFAPGQAVRIFTGAPLPEGADHVVIQEDVTRAGDQITINENPDSQSYVRPAGADFSAGFTLGADRVLGPQDIALLAAMNCPDIPVRIRPRIAILATGDELVHPGETPGPDQIICSNNYGLAAMLENTGAIVQLMPIARDKPAILTDLLTRAAQADLVITIGGASVGDHDLVQSTAKSLGMSPEFYKIAMRPGKPLMAGTLLGAMMIGLPGNPVSAMVCGHVFVLPVLRQMLGLTAENHVKQAELADDIPANGPRAHYMRGALTGDGVKVFTRQDSALLTVLNQADALVIRPPNDPARRAGELVDYLAI